MKRKVPLLLIFIAFAFSTFAQIPVHPNKIDASGKRQGMWTILYDADWNVIKKADSATFYRIANYKDNVPMGKTHDYYHNGNVQWEGTILQDEPQILDGLATEYYPDGEVDVYHIYEKGNYNTPKTIIEMQKLAQQYAGIPEKYERHARTLNVIGLLYQQTADYDKSVATFKEALAVMEKQNKKYTGAYVRTLYSLAAVYHRLNNEKEKLSILSYIPSIEREVYQDDTLSLAFYLKAYGSTLEEFGYYAEAAKSFEELTILESKLHGKESLPYTDALDLVAWAYSESGDYIKSEAAAKEALQLSSKLLSNEDLEYAKYLNRLGWTYTLMGDGVKAEPLLKEALRIREKVLGRQHVDYAVSINNLASLYYDQGYYSRSEEMLEESLDIIGKTAGKRHWYYGQSLGNMGVAYVQTKKYHKAEECYVTSLEMFAKIYGKDHPSYILQLTNLGRAYAIQGKFAAGEPYLKESVKSREKLGSNNPDFIVSVNHLAQLYSAMGKKEEAKSYFLRGVTKKHYMNALFIAQHANFYFDNKFFSIADTLFKQATEIRLNEIRENFPVMSEQQREAYYKNCLAEYFSTYNSFAVANVKERPSITADMYDLQLATKAVLLNSSAKWKQRIRQSGDVKLFSLYQEWEGLSKRLAKAETETQTTEDIATLRIKTEELEKTLTKRSELFSKSVDKKKYSWKDVAAKLQKNEAAIEIIRYHKRGVKTLRVDSSDVKLTRYPQIDLTDTIHYAVLMVKNGMKFPQLILLSNGNELEEKYLKNYQNSIHSQLPDLVSFEQYWGSIAKQLKGIRKVYISGDGVFHRINLNTLKNPKTGKFVADEIEVVLVTNTKDLLQPVDDVSANHYALLMGMPDFKLSADQQLKLAKSNTERLTTGYKALERSIENLEELPGTKIEVEKIAEILRGKEWQTDVYIQKNALEENIKDAFKPAILHIATHGYFKPDTELESVAQENENPLLQSGLILAGAGIDKLETSVTDVLHDKVQEDGILTAYEAMNLNLDNTELVVLSACETGLGEIKNGEGVYGLQRAFTVAGARSIIMSLWKVNDQITQELMILFYQKWLNGMPKSLAFRQAQFDLRKEHPDPYFWGAFVMIGDK